MSQSAILKAAYETIYKNISELGEENGLFQVSNGSMETLKGGKQAEVYLGISDLCQLYTDKNGQKVEMDEMIFEVPARVGCILFMTIISRTYPSLLETAGWLIQYFKDNNAIQLEDYKWHGENEGKIFIEPVIRKPELLRRPQSNDLPAIILEYQLEVGINSQKGVSFKRVEKKILKGNIIDK
jgi:hypothetical protein